MKLKTNLKPNANVSINILTFPDETSNKGNHIFPPPPNSFSEEPSTHRYTDLCLLNLV